MTKGRLPNKTDKACWFPLMQFWFSTERASSIQSLAGGSHVVNQAVQLC